MPRAVPALLTLALLAAGGVVIGGEPPGPEPRPMRPGEPPPPAVPPGPASPKPAPHPGPMAPAPPPAAPAPPAGPRPRAVLDREAHDFGVVKQEADLQTTFLLTNAGDAPLEVGSLRADCGCSSATADDRTLAVGASTTVRVALHTYRMSGTLVKRVFVPTNDPERKELEIRISAEIAGGIVLSPAYFYFGPVLAGTTPECKVVAKWKEGVGKPFRVTEVEAPGLDLAFEVTPFEEPPYRGFSITARFRKPAAVGTVSGTALLRTDDPEYARLAAPVTAFVSGRVWVDRREVRLGMVREGAGRTMQVGCRGLTPDVDLGTVKAAARHGRVVVEARRAAGNTKEWLIEVSLPTTAPPGKVEDVVEVRSSVPGEPPAEIAVTGEVMPAR